MVSLSFFSTIGVLAFVLWSSVGREDVPHGSLADAAHHPLAIPFTAAAIAVAVASFALKGVLSRPNPALSPELALQKAFAATLVGLALSEAVGLFGFVLGQSSRCFGIAAPFFCVSVALMIVHNRKT
jgi:hypothetical protein